MSITKCRFNEGPVDNYQCIAKPYLHLCLLYPANSKVNNHEFTKNLCVSMGNIKCFFSHYYAILDDIRRYEAHTDIFTDIL